MLKVQAKGDTAHDHERYERRWRLTTEKGRPSFASRHNLSPLVALAKALGKLDVLEHSSCFCQERTGLFPRRLGIPASMIPYMRLDESDLGSFDGERLARSGIVQVQPEQLRKQIQVIN